MKALWIVLGALGIAGAYLYFSRRSQQAAPIGDSTPTPDNVQDVVFIPPAGEGGSTGGSSAPPSAPTEAGSEALSDPGTEQANTALAENQPQEDIAGFTEQPAAQPIPTIPVNFLTVERNPVTGMEQAIFQRTDNKGVPAAAVFNLPAGKAFIEQIPAGAASTAPNVILFDAVDKHQATKTKVTAESKAASEAFAKDKSAKNAQAYVKSLIAGHAASKAATPKRTAKEVLKSLSSTDKRRKGVEAIAKRSKVVGF